MNWKGYLVLGLLATGIIAYFGYNAGVQSIKTQRYHAAAIAIEQASRGKLDVMDIELERTPNGTAVLQFFMFADQSSVSLTDQEFEAVDTEFMKLAVKENVEFIIWAWARPDNAGDWKVTIITICNLPSLLAARETGAPADCQTQQSFNPLSAKHLRWYDGNLENPA